MTLAHIQYTYMIFFQTILFQNLSLTIAHCFFFAKKLSKLCFKTFLFCKWKFCRKQKCDIFSSLFPLDKRFKGLTAWEFFWFSLPPLDKRFKGLTTWEFFWFFPFPLNKRFQRTNYLRYLLFPLTKNQGTNRLRILCLNTLERTSFVVHVERTSTWVVILRKREGTSLVDQFKWSVHPLGCSKRTREGTSLVDLCL